MQGNNEWTHHTQQNNQINHLRSEEISIINMASIATTPQSIVIDQKLATFSQEHQQKQQQQQNNQQEPLRCPRCDSSNTKFCYYNNYSLSQPRHFCKACKRYWTRGGTLRTVPVGGGYRKNKRVIKRPLNIISNNISSTTSTPNNYNPNNFGESSVNSLFYGMSTNNNHIDFPLSRHDIHNLPQFNGLGLGLVHNNNNNNNSNNNHKHIFHDLISSSNPLISNINNNNNNIFASSFQMKGGETIIPSYEDSVQMKGGMFVKDVKMEIEGQNRKMDNYWSGPSQSHMDHNMMGSSSLSNNDPYVVWGNGPNLGPWLNPNNNNNNNNTNTNLASSFPSLI